MKFGLKEFKKPTPKLMKRLGATFMGISVFVSSYAFYNSHEVVGMVGLVSGIIGTIITNMFSDTSE